MTHLSARSLHEPPGPGWAAPMALSLGWPQVTSEEPAGDPTRPGLWPAEAGLELQQVTTTQQLPPDPRPGPIISDER